MGLRRAFVPALVCGGLLAVAGSASAAGDSVVSPVYGVDTAGYPAVSLMVGLPSALTRAGVSPPGGLTVLVDGRPVPASVALTPRSLSVVLVLDTASSVPVADRGALKAAAVAFMLRLPARTRLGVVSAGSPPVVIQPLTPDRNVATAALSRLFWAGAPAQGGAVDQALGLLTPTDDARAAMLLCSFDGGPMPVQPGLADQLRTAAGSGVTLHAVEFGSGPDTLAEVTADGGETVRVLRPADLTPAFVSIADGLDAPVRVSFRTDLHGAATVQVGVQEAGLRAVGTRTVTLPGPPSAAADPVSTDPPVADVLAASVVALLVLALAVVGLAGRPRRPPGRHVAPARRRTGFML